MRKVMCYDNETIKWNHDGENYCVHIQQDNSNDIDPRDYDHDSVMACFGKYKYLGDRIEYDSAKDFWIANVYGHCSDEEIFDALKERKLVNIYVDYYQDMEKDEYFYALCDMDNGDCFVDGLAEDEVASEAKYWLEPEDCMILMDHGSHAMWLPLYVYDHSGVSMHTECSGDKWDTSCVGWIVTPMCQNHTSADEMKATRVMQQEVKEYNDWLQGEVYRYTLYKQNGWVSDDIECSASPNWEEVDDCGGFIGDDIIENGMAYNIGNGIEEAIQSEKYTTGTAKKTVVVKWEFYPLGAFWQECKSL